MAQPELQFLVNSLLLDYDIDSASGCLPLMKRTNLLVEMKSTVFSEDRLTMTMNQYSPEGFGFQRFWQDTMYVPGDKECERDLTLIWDAQMALPPKHMKLWLMQVFEDPCDVRSFHFDSQSAWAFVTSPHREPATLHHLELFAGGMGGWSSTLDCISSLTSMQTQSIGVEIDLNTAVAFALNNASALVHTHNTLPLDFQTLYSGNWIICDDVRSWKWLPAITKWGVDLVTISAPCPSWSFASTSEGLWKEEGQLFIHSILKCRFLRPTYIAMENVSGFCSHDHKNIIERALRWIGFRLVWQQVWDIKGFMGVSRSRWTALAKRVHSDLPTPALARSLMPLTPPKPADWTSCLFDWTPSDLQPLLLTQQIASVASDPRKASKQVDKLKTPTEVLALRMHGSAQILPTFLARYGSQHELNDQFLNQHGYLGFFCKHDDLPFGGRFFHPAEIALIHGVVDRIFIPSDMRTSWQIVGNCITMLHAMPALVNVVNAFTSTPVDMEQVLKTFQNRRLQSEAVITHADIGSFYTNIAHIPTEDFLASLCDLKITEFPVNHTTVWIPAIGTVSLEGMTMESEPVTCSVFPDVRSREVGTPVTVNSSPTPEELTDHPTVPFSVVLPAAIHIGDSFQHFWFSAELTADAIETPWLRAYECAFPPDSDSHAITKLIPRQPALPLAESFDTSFVHLLIDQQLTLFRAIADTPLVEHTAISQAAEQLFDPFGPLSAHQTADSHTLVTTQPMQHGQYDGACHGGILALLAALELANVQTKWNAMTDSFAIHISGEPHAVSLVTSFWTQILPMNMQTHLGRQVDVTTTAEGGIVSFCPIRTHGIVPHQPFAVCLSVFAFRTLMHSALVEYQDVPTISVVLKWTSRPLWQGPLPVTFAAGLIIKFLKHALIPVNGPTQHRLICNAKQVMPPTLIAELQPSDRHQAVLLHVVMQLTGGGGNGGTVGAKNQMRILQQTALASYLLERGYDLQWISKAADQLLQKYNIARIQAITAMPAGNAKLTALLSLCKEADIVIPEPTKPSTRKETPGAPWNRPKKRRGGDQIDPQEYAIVDTFFRNQDGTVCQVLPQIRPHASGVCMMTTSQASPWLQTDEKLSGDELAILVIGVKPETKIQHTEIAVPCHNLDGQMVLVKCAMYQLGTKEVTYQKGDPQQTDSAKCVLMAITLYKPDFSPEQWNDATQRTMPFIRKILEAEDLAESVFAMWGRSFRSDKAPCAPMQAQTIQVHCSIGLDHVTKFLARSGFNFLFCTPKRPNGRLSTEYRVIWIQMDSRQAAVASAKLPACLGLVRGKKSLGLRFKDADHDAAWDVLFPQMPKPSHFQGDLMFKAEALPFGTTFDMMKQWATKINWACQPVRSLGPQAMLLRSDRHPPEGVLMFNCSPILVRHLPAKTAPQGPIVVGPRAGKTAKEPTADGGHFDPWASYTGLKPASSAMPARTPDGPTETRLTAQDHKLQAIETQLKDLAQKQEGYMKHTESRFLAAEEREKAQLQQVSKTMESVKRDLDRAMHAAFQQSTSVMEERMAELKHLLAGPAKRPAPESGDMQD